MFKIVFLHLLTQLVPQKKWRYFYFYSFYRPLEINVDSKSKRKIISNFLVYIIVDKLELPPMYTRIIE